MQDPQEPIQPLFDPSKTGTVKPNTYTPEITNRAVPQLNFFQAPEVPGWEYEDYRKWVDEVEPFDKEINEQIQGKQKELEEAVSIGAITPQYADNQLQTFSETLFQEVEPKIVKATKKMFTVPRVEKIEQKEKLIEIKDPVAFEAELYNPADYGQTESKLNILDSRRQKAETQLSALPDNEAERRVELETEIALIDSQKRQFKLPTVKPIFVEREGEGNVYVVDKYGAESRVIERKFIPEGPVYDQDQLKEGDIIDLPNASKIWFKKNKDGQEYFLGVDTQEDAQGYRVYKENGEFKLDPIKQIGIDPVFTPARRDETIDPNELADRMELYSKQTGSDIFKTILYKEEVEGKTRLRSGLYGDFVDDYNELAEYFYNRPELAKEFGVWAKDNAWETFIDSKSTPDIQRVMNLFFDAKKEEKMKMREQTGIKDTDARLAYEAQGVVERNQAKFLEYKERKLKEIQSLRDEYKRNPSEDLKNKTEKLIAAYNKSYENYKTFADSQGQYLTIAGDPSFVKYDKISKEIDDLTEAKILNNKYFSANIPSTERLAAGAAKTQVKDATVGSAIESVNNAVVGKVGQMFTGMAGFFSDGESYGRASYYGDIVKNFNNSQRFREEDANGKTIWKNYLTNRAQDAGQAGVDIATMVLAPNVKWFNSAYLNRLPGLFGTISATNYNDAYKEAKEAGLSGEGRHAYAVGNMLINTMFEGMFDVKKLFKGLDVNAIDVLKQRYRGEVGKHLPEIVNQATRKQGLLNLVTTAKDFAKINFSPKGLANSFISSAEEMILEEGLTDAALNLFNIGINRALRTNLDEQVFTEKSMKDLIFTGLIMAPFMGAGRSLNTAISLNDGKNVLYQVANEVGYDKVIGQLQTIKDNPVAQDLLREMPYAATINKPEDITDDRWFFLQEKTARRQFLAAKIDQMSDPLKPYYKEQVKMLDEDIRNIMSLPEEAIVKRREEVEGSFKESLTKLLEAPKEEAPSQQQVSTELAPSGDQVGTKSGLSKIEGKVIETQDEFLGRQISELGDMYSDVMEGEIKNEYYQNIEDEIKAGGTISIDVYNSLSDGQRYAFNKKYGKNKIGSETLFHSTNKDFSDFDINKSGTTTDSGWFGEGVYFFQDKKDAEDFSLRNSDSKVKEVEVSLKNPLILKSEKIPTNVIEAFEKRGVSVETIFDVQRFSLKAKENPQKVTDVFLSQGYDGLRLDLFPKKEVVVFNTSQINTPSGIKPSAEIIPEEVQDIEPPAGEVADEAPVSPEETKEGFTEGVDLNRMFNEVKEKYGKKGSSIYDTAIRLVNPNQNTIIEIRSNGVVVKEGGEYLLKPFTDTDMNQKKWKLGRPLDVSDQFKDIQTEAQVENEVGESQIANQESVAPQEVESQKQQELLAATKPSVSLDFIPEKQLQNKQVQVTFEDAETGEQLFQPQSASKVQASIKARFEILNKLIDCIG